MTWLVRGLAALALLVVGWIAAVAWDAVAHGHPLYAVLLALTALVAVLVIGLGLRRRSAPDRRRSDRDRPPRRRALRTVGTALVAVGSLAWLGVLLWLTPFTAVEPALGALRSDDAVAVRESATRIVLEPTSGAAETAVFFQPGARVDARAYAAVRRPLAEAGYPVVIAKQPLGIGFLATGAFESARTALPDVDAWVVGGHSLGGVVAAIDADAHDADSRDQDVTAPVPGLLLYASFPASDLSTTLTGAVLSVSGTEDGLSTPEDIEASRADLPPDAEFVAIEGAVHAFFGDYGPQPGDGAPTISQDEARARIAEVSVEFVAGLAD